MINSNQISIDFDILWKYKIKRNNKIKNTSNISVML
jgi:hypothetical protein